MNRCLLVRGGIGEAGCCQSDSLVGSVIDRVESLKKSLAEDKVQSRTFLGANVSNNQVNAIGSATNQGVKGTRPDLSVSSKFKCSLIGMFV